MLVTASSFISFIRGTTGRSRCLQLKEKPTAANRLRLVLFLPSATGRREKLFSIFFFCYCCTHAAAFLLFPPVAHQLEIFFSKKFTNFTTMSLREQLICMRSVKSKGQKRRHTTATFLGELRESKRSAFRPLNDAILSRYQRQQQAPSVHV